MKRESIYPLTDILTPDAHERIIDRLTADLADVSLTAPLEAKRLINKINWHTREYQKKTGQLPK